MKESHLEAVESALEQAINESAKPEAGNWMRLEVAQKILQGLFKAVRKYGCSMVYSQQHMFFFFPDIRTAIWVIEITQD